MPEPTPDHRSPPAGPGLSGRCPRCGQGRLFTGPFTLTVAPGCDRCGLDYSFADAGDGPAIFAIFILGVLVLGAALIAEFKFGVSALVHVLLWGIATPVLALVLLRWLKARLIRQQLKHKAGEGRVDQSRDRPG